MDLTNLTLAQIVIGLIAITLCDLIAGVGTALAHGTFAWSAVAQFVSTHILGRVIPLSFLAAVGTGIAQIGLAPNPAIFAIFLAGAAAYIAETIASISANVQAPAPTPHG